MFLSFSLIFTLILQRDTVQAASEFAARNQLPQNVKDQMLSHICLRFKTEELKQQETMNGLPKGIRSSIAQYLFFPIAQQVYLFQGVSYDFTFQLVRLLKSKLTDSTLSKSKCIHPHIFSCIYLPRLETTRLQKCKQSIFHQKKT